MRVDNGDFAAIGHLPQKEASWIAPLIDAGKLIIDGSVSDAQPAKTRRALLRVKLYLTPKGFHTLEASSGCSTEAQAIHEVILAAYRLAENCHSPQLVRTVSKRLASITDRHSLPETHMLLRLFEAQTSPAADGKRGTSEEAIQRFLRQLHIGKAKHFRNLTLFPIFGADNPRTDYVVLEDALNADIAAVTEISDEGSIPELTIHNRGGKPILIPEGMIILGGKQDRTVNISIIVEAHQEMVLPVSCVERGRWSHRRRNFQTGHFAPAGLRSRKMASVRKNLRTTGRARSDQGDVWNEVANCLSGIAAESPTDSLHASYEMAEDRSAQYAKHLTIEDAAIGVIFASGESIIGMDIFDSPHALKAVWPRLSRGYFLDCVTRKDAAKKTLKRQATKFLNHVSSSVSVTVHDEVHPGHFELEIQGYVGSGLLHKDRVCHLSVFPSPTGQTDDHPRRCTFRPLRRE